MVDRDELMIRAEAFAKQLLLLTIKYQIDLARPVIFTVGGNLTVEASQVISCSAKGNQRGLNCDFKFQEYKTSTVLEDVE